MYKNFIYALVLSSILSQGNIAVEQLERVPILLYHHILSDEENKIHRDNGAVLSLENFEQQMKYLHDNGYHTLTLDELHDFLYEKKSLPKKSVLITFDDGYYSNIVRAYPVLKKYNFKATIFLITSYVREKQLEFHPDYFAFTASETLYNYVDVFEYASHTHKMHKTLDNKKTILYQSEKDEIIEDINKSFEFTTNNTALAYPLGQYNKNTIEALEECGITMAMTTKDGYITKNNDKMQLHRFIIYSDTTFEDFKRIVNLKYRS